MATLTIRNLPDATRDILRIRAARNGRSMEAEVRHVLIEATACESGQANTQSTEQLRRWREAQRRISALLPADVSLADELIADRRREQQAEDRE